MNREIKPVFAKDEIDEVFRRIKQQVIVTVRELTPHRRPQILFKAILFPLLFLAAYTLLLVYGNSTWVLYTSYCLMGIMLVVIFLNLVHEAVHQTLFKKRWLNDLYIHLLDLLGANSFVWKIRHTRLHHNYPNIRGWDSDIEQSGLARIFPTGPYKSIHRYQHLYLPALYPLFLFNWLLIRDFKDYFNKNKIVWKVITIPRKEYRRLFLFKALFIFYTLLLPKLLLGISWIVVISGFCIMMLTASLLALLVLISPHANTENEFPLPDADNRMQRSWFLHQLYNTNDVKEDNWITRFFMGSFNYHISHHLFPHVHHIFYPDITKIIREEALRNNLPYRSYPLLTTLYNHYKLLRQNRLPEDIFEETM